jgi:hypothetical protein
MKHAVSLVVCLFAACGVPEDGAAPVVRESAPLVTEHAPIASSSILGDWRARVAADLASLRADKPALLTELAQMSPARTRAGLLRFTTRIDADPRATAVFLDRLAQGGGSAAERAALVEVLPRTNGAFADALAELYAAEPDAEVRAVYAFSTRRAPEPYATSVIRTALADPSPVVQAEAARSAAAHPAGAKLATELEAALSSPDATTRAAAARALGIHQVGAAQASLTAKLDDADPEVRLAALRARERIAPGSLPAMKLRALASDSDPRVARLAAKLAGTAAPSQR